MVVRRYHEGAVKRPGKAGRRTRPTGGDTGMPKHVDHEERRAQIADALIRVAGRRGLHAVGMRDVAAEAGVSLRLVQYYIETKEKLLFYGRQHLTHRFTARVGARLAAAGADPGPRATV